MLHECRATHDLWGIWDAEMIVALIFKCDLRKRKSPVKPGQIWLHFKIQSFLTKARVSELVLS